MRRAAGSVYLNESPGADTPGLGERARFPVFEVWTLKDSVRTLPKRTLVWTRLLFSISAPTPDLVVGILLRQRSKLFDKRRRIEIRGATTRVPLTDEEPKLFKLLE